MRAPVHGENRAGTVVKHQITLFGQVQNVIWKQTSPKESILLYFLAPCGSRVSPKLENGSPNRDLKRSKNMTFWLSEPLAGYNATA